MRTQQIGDPEQAEVLVGPFRVVLRGAITGAFDDWAALLGKAPTETGGLTAFTRTRFIHDRIIQRLAIAETTGEFPGLRIAKVKGLHVAILHDRLMLKLKKLNATLRSRNIQTQQTMDFDKQEPLLPSDMGLLTNATGGYVVDRGSSEIAKIVVVCWEGLQRRWVVDLAQEEAGTGGVVITVPAGPVPQSGQPRTRVVDESRADETEAKADDE